MPNFHPFIAPVRGKCAVPCDSGVIYDPMRRGWVMWHSVLGKEKKEKFIPETQARDTFETIGSLFLEWLEEFHRVV